MHTVIILSKHSSDLLREYRYLFQPFVDKGAISFCDWNESGTDLEMSVPDLYKQIRGKVDWRAVIVSAEPVYGNRKGPVPDEKNPFERAEISEPEHDTENESHALLEQMIKDLCRVKKSAVIVPMEEKADRYRITVNFEGVGKNGNIYISPYASKQTKAINEQVEFTDLETLQLTEFYEVIAKQGEAEIRRIIMIPTTGFPENRENAVVNSVVKDQNSFVEYIVFVLGDDYLASMLERKQIGESGFFRNSHNVLPALYEKMLKTSVDEPERLRDIGYILRMVTDKEIIPDEFRSLYDTFCKTIKIKG